MRRDDIDCRWTGCGHDTSLRQSLQE
jgi:hypothetical protein